VSFDYTVCVLHHPYLTLPLPYLRGGRRTRQRLALRPPGGPIACPRKAEGYKNLPEAFASFRSKGHRVLHNSLKSI